jgi:glycogen synthase
MREARRLAMGLDFSWEASAREYETVYRGGGPEPA